MAVNHLVTGSNPVGGAIFNLFFNIRIYYMRGEMAEWSKATVLKTVVSQGTQGSNPCFSAIFFELKLGRVPERLNGLPC